jgi:hypothetical protein
MIHQVPVPELVALQQRAEALLEAERERTIAQAPAAQRPALRALLAEADALATELLTNRMLYG